jgi:putative heme iron utilization protein
MNAIEATVRFHEANIKGMDKEQALFYHKRLREDMNSRQADEETEKIYREIKDRLWKIIQTIDEKE